MQVKYRYLKSKMKYRFKEKYLYRETNTYKYSKLEKENIFDCIYKSNFSTVKKLLSGNQMLVHSINEDGKTPLYYSIQYNQYKIAKLLVLKGSPLTEEIKLLIEKSELELSEIEQLHESYISSYDQQLYTEVVDLAGEDESDSCCIIC